MTDLADRKLTAEIAKLEAETTALKGSALTKVGNALKVIGAVVIGAGGALASVTTFQVVELKNQIAKADGEKIADANRQLETQLTAKQKQLVDTNKFLEDAKAKLSDANAKGSQYLAQLDALSTTAAAAVGDRDHAGAAPTSGGKPQPAPTGLRLTALTSEISKTARLVKNAGMVLVVPAVQEQQGAAEAIAADLKGRGYSVITKPPLRNPRRAPEVTEVRFFQTDEKTNAADILATVKKLDSAEAKTAPVHDPEITFPKYFEVRLARPRREATMKRSGGESR